MAFLLITYNFKLLLEGIGYPVKFVLLFAKPGLSCF